MRYTAALAVIAALGLAGTAAAQEVVVPAPTVTYYAPSVPVTTYVAPAPTVTYYAPSVPVTTYYAPAYTTYYAPAVTYVATPYYTYVPPRVVRRWYRNGYVW
jgi:hypothetical protein